MLTDILKQRIKDLNILVIGDIMLDMYIVGDSNRLSPEAPVPVVNVQHIQGVLGGAANVANNLSSIGVNVHLCGLLGNDGDMYNEVRNLLILADINHKGVVTDSSRTTTVKTRVMSGNQQIVRYDVEDTHEYNGGKLTDSIIKHDNLDAIIISDYGKGVITDDLMWFTYISRVGVPIIVDPNINNYAYYKNRAHTITPNTNEALEFHKDENLNVVGFKMVEDLGCKNVIITKGKDGLCIYDNKNRNKEIKVSEAKQVFDVSGAGDTFTSVYTVGIALGLSVFESSTMANEAAGKVVCDVGTSVIGDRI